MKANIHHPYSIRHIGIGFWIGSYVVFMVTVHVPPYETKHPYSILHHAYRYWVMACVICCFYGDGPCTDIWKHTSIIHTQSRILYIYIGSWLGSYVVFMVTDHMYICIYVHSVHMYICIVYMYRYISYICIYTQYPIPNKKNTTSKDPVFAKSSTLFWPIMTLKLLYNICISLTD